ncbi:MAG: C15orf41 family protein [Thermoplasmata archaeon]
MVISTYTDRFVKRMKYDFYKEIYSQLRKPSDIDHLAKRYGLDRELLLVMYTQRTVRDATRRFYIVKKDIKKIAREWRKGVPIVKLAREMNFPPVLLGLLLAPEIGLTRKQFWKYLRENDSCPGGRIKKEMKQVAEADIIYSPRGAQIQTERGQWGERRLHDWLDKRDIKYRTEADLRATHKKTPDCLLAKPIQINGTKVHWIESKASFGDEVELRKNARRQLKPYTDMFGTGAVVYWFGFVEGIEPPEGVVLLDGSFFDDCPGEDPGGKRF